MNKIKVLLITTIISFNGFSQNDFTFEFFNNIDDQENILFSPTSIKTAFAMAYEGTDGATQHEFEKVFDFKPNNEQFLEEIKQLKEVAQINNSVWIQNKFKVLASFVKRLKSNFDSAPYHTDFKKDPFGSAKKINEWIESSTNGMIKKMLSADDVKDFKLAIVNAIYFKQNWKNKFDKEATKKAEFTNADGTTTQVDMMHSSGHYKAAQGRNEAVIELPYDDDKTSMVIVLPNKMKNYKMTNETYNELTTKMASQQVRLYLPKFTFETPTFELKKYLQKMGLEKAFTDSADFSQIRKEKDLKIGTAMHKAKIIVNEEGTEAAAATVIGMVQITTAAMPPLILNINVNKPFFYFIKDNASNTILFMGKMNTIK